MDLGRGILDNAAYKQHINDGYIATMITPSVPKASKIYDKITFEKNRNLCERTARTAGGVFGCLFLCWCCCCLGNQREFDKCWDEAFGDKDRKIEYLRNLEAEKKANEGDVKFLGFDMFNRQSMKNYVENAHNLQFIESHGHLFKIYFLPSTRIGILFLPYQNQEKISFQVIFNDETEDPLENEQQALQAAMTYCKNYREIAAMEKTRLLTKKVIDNFE